ncbi:MAG: hypothetical protein Q8L56_05800 [Rhodocyclaceae bacterium]|nr:hypothetical protein [Rhodocyclaceae bacterium]
MSMFWLIAGLIVAGAAWLFMKQRGRKSAVPVEESQPAKKTVWGKRIVVPAGKPCCIAAKVLSSQPFPVDAAPQLPLVECTNKANCECRYEPLFERRGYMERRSGMERRPNLRFDLDKPPRRNGRDRRKDKNNPFGDGAI